MYSLSAFLVPAQLPKPFNEVSSRGCGVASILTQLCFVDNDVNADVGFDIHDDKRFRNLKEQKNIFKLPGNQAMLELADQSYEKILYLWNCANPSSAANTYFNAAKKASYTKMIISTNDGQKMGAYDVDKIQEEYNRIDDNRNMKACHKPFGMRKYGSQWYFCKLKQL